MSLRDRIMRWLNPQRTRSVQVQLDDHDRRLVLANRRQQQLAARVGRLEAEADLILHREGR